jgi:aspartate/methionine/tyrosine aminotransferase
VKPFALERYFAKHEFSAPYLLSPSDTEARTLSDLLSRADQECRHLWHSLALGYTESRGLPALRTAIAAFVCETNHVPHGTLTADDVLVFSCAEEAIYTVARVLIRRDDRVACIWPAYQSLFQVATECGAVVNPIPARIVDGKWDMRAEDIEVAVPAGTRLVVANIPHNPTGMVPSNASWRRLYDQTLDSGGILFSDEVYRPLVGGGDTLPPSPALSNENTSVTLGSVSKAFGLAGVRIGWVATKDQTLLTDLETYKDYTTICASAPAEVLALIALRDWRSIVEEQQAIIAHNSGIFDEFMKDVSNLIEPAPIASGTTCFPRWRGPGTALEMAERAVESSGIMVLPGDTFDPEAIGPDDGDLRQRFRVGLGRRSFPDVISRFRDHLNATY